MIGRYAYIHQNREYRNKPTHSIEKGYYYQQSYWDNWTVISEKIKIPDSYLTSSKN